MLLRPQCGAVCAAARRAVFSDSVDPKGASDLILKTGGAGWRPKILPTDVRKAEEAGWTAAAVRRCW